MQNAFIIVIQVLMMAVYVLAGFALVKTGKVDANVSRSLSNILIYAVTPGVILNALQREYIAHEARSFVLALGLSLLSFCICIAAAHLLVRPGRCKDRTGMERFSLVMPNAGYIGIPLAQAVLGEAGAFFLTAYLVMFNLLLFSYGRFQLLSDGARRGGGAMPRAFSRESFSKSLINPATVSTVIGGVLYFCNFRLPAPLLGAVKGFAGLNSVLSMLLIGVFVSQTDLKSLPRFTRGFYLGALRLFALPLAVMGVLLFMDFSAFVPDAGMVKTAVVVAACTPVSVASSFMGELCGADNLHAVKLITLSTLISIFSMPVMLLVWDSLNALVR